MSKIFLVRILKAKYSNKKISFSDYVRSVLRPLYSPIEAMISEITNEPETILDVGCGTGILSFLVGSLRRNKKISGIDVNEASIRLARLIHANDTNLNFKVGGVADIPYLVQDFDSVLLFDVLHHLSITDQENTILEICKSQKKGSVVYLKDLDDAPLLKALFNRVTDYISTRSKVNYYGMKGFENIFLSKGYRIRIKKRFHYSLWAHYILVAEKVA